MIEQLQRRLQWRQETTTAGEAAHAGSGPGAVWLCPGGGGPAAGRAVGAAPAGALSAAHPGTPAPEAEDARSRRGLVAQGGGAAAGVPGRGGPALGRPVHAGVAQPAHRPGAHGAACSCCCSVAPSFTRRGRRARTCSIWPCSRLSRPQVETMVERLTGGKALPAEVLRQLVATTDGVPLFVEELTKMVLESGLVKEREGHYELTGPLPPLAIPATLHDSLMARLDRLSAGKRVAQLGAVMGRQFAYALLRAVAPWEEETLQRALGQLVDAELLYPARLPSRGDLPVQTCADPGGGLSVTAHAHPATVPPADCPGVGGALSGDRRDPARTAGPSLHGGGPRQGRPCPTGSRPGNTPSRARRMLEARQHLTTGLEVLATVPGDTRAPPARAGSPDGPRPGVGGHEGPGGT